MSTPHLTGFASGIKYRGKPVTTKKFLKLGGPCTYIWPNIIYASKEQIVFQIYCNVYYEYLTSI
jgi:hypothetical protein